MSTSDSARIARAYFDAWSSKKGTEVLRPLMAEGFSFSAGEMHVEGRDNFLAGGNWPDGAVTTLIAEAYDGEHGFQLYSAVNGNKVVRIVEYLTVRDGVVVASEIITDQNQFMAFMTG